MSFDTAFLHSFQKRHRARDIVVVVKKWLFNRFTDSFESRKVDHGINFVFLERRDEFFLVANITFNEGRACAGDCFNSVNHFGLAVGEVVVKDCCMAGFDQTHRCMRADEARAACQKNFHLKPRCRRLPQ